MPPAAVGGSHSYARFNQYFLHVCSDVHSRPAGMDLVGLAGGTLEGVPTGKLTSKE